MSSFTGSFINFIDQLDQTNLTVEASILDSALKVFGKESIDLNGWMSEEEGTKLLKERDGEQPEAFDTKAHSFDIHIDRPKDYIHFIPAKGIACKYKCDYGEFKGYIGKDGELLDIFIGPQQDVKEVHILTKGGADPEDKITFFMTLDVANTLYDPKTVQKVRSYDNADKFYEAYLKGKEK